MAAAVVVVVAAFAAAQWVAVQVTMPADVSPAIAAQFRDVVLETWAELDVAFGQPATAATSAPSAVLALRTSTTLPPQLMARSTPGIIELRPSALAALDAGTALALRHEVVHHYLWQRCPQSSRDRLFHEAMAVAFSGEVEHWRRASYLTTPQAVAILARADLDTPQARRALSRLVSEGSGVSVALRRGLRRCADDAPWVPLQVGELADDEHVAGDDALVVMSTVTGAVLEARGAVTSPMPVGSTLKPFIVHAAVADGITLPRLPVRAAEPLWACGDGKTFGAEEALLASCNGWFLDVETLLREARTSAAEKASSPLGSFGPLFVARQTSALPADMSEAIGVRSTVRMSPLAMAELWRVLMLADAPQGLDVRRALQKLGTLDGADDVAELAGMSTKTGTVRDSASRPVLGILVAADDELVVIRTRRGVAGRGASADVAAAVKRHRHRRHHGVSVQVFGLVPADDVVARCAGTMVSLTTTPTLTGAAAPDRRGRGVALRAATAGGAQAVCVGAPFSVTPTAGRDERPYAGVFAWSPPPSVSTTTPADPTTTPRQRAARRGSDFLFRTARGAYASGVLRAEDASLRGEAKVALLKVIDHNVDAGAARHPQRPVCDTTHCQTFLGTDANEKNGDDVVAAAIADAYTGPGARAWLPFSQGGEALWQQTRPVFEVRAAVGAFVSLHVKSGAVVVVRQRVGRDGPYDDPEPFDCERLRSRLRLPSCPSAASVVGDHFTFTGVGAGHGLGLDVEGAKAKAAAGTSAADILRDAYPR